MDNMETQLSEMGFEQHTRLLFVRDQAYLRAEFNFKGESNLSI